MSHSRKMVIFHNYVTNYQKVTSKNHFNELGRSHDVPGFYAMAKTWFSESLPHGLEHGIMVGKF